MVGGGLFPSPPVTKKSPTPTEKSPTVISKRCWTLEYSGELEFSSPFMEQWTLDARGVLSFKRDYEWQHLFQKEEMLRGGDLDIESDLADGLPQVPGEGKQAIELRK